MRWKQWEDMVVVLHSLCCQCSHDMVQGLCEHIVLHEHIVLSLCRASVITWLWWCCQCSIDLVVQEQQEHNLQCADMGWEQWEDLVVVVH